MAAIESLDDVFALCPNATEIKLELHDLGCGYHTLTHFEPNTTVEILDIELYDPREANLKYLCQKFPNVKELVFSVKRFEMDKDSRCSDAEFINPLWMSAEAIAFLLNYAHSREKFCMTLGLLETIEPFLATSASLRWQGEMTTTCYRDEEIWFIYDRFKPQKLHLSFKNHVPRFETSQITSMKAYLNQLDELDIENNPYLKLKQLMTHCTSLRALKWHLCSENTYEGPVLPITHLTLLSYDSNRNRKFLKQLHSFMPNLRDLILCTKFLMESEIEIDLSSACLQSFCINSKNDKTWLYLHLVRSGEDTYYCRQNTQPRHMSPKYSLQQIEGNEYGLRAPTCSRLHMGSYCGLDVSTYTIQKVKIICKDIKRLEVRGHSNRHDIFDFPKPMTTEDFSQRVSLSFYN
ncbi:hypothetical protein EDC96DRAFT_508879 [Choanephora cucurbitarum]|nr:hypothetical protein EDC96DRAFT_508879 [Choanephora cucurbitarum]